MTFDVTLTSEVDVLMSPRKSKSERKSMLRGPHSTTNLRWRIFAEGRGIFSPRLQKLGGGVISGDLALETMMTHAKQRLILKLLVHPADVNMKDLANAVFTDWLQQLHVPVYTYLLRRQSWIAYPPPRLWTSSHGKQHLVIREAISLFFYTNCLNCISFAKSKRCQDV